jgi:hypothetical protein
MRRVSCGAERKVGGFAILRDLLEPLGLPNPVIDLVAGVCGSCPQFLRGSLRKSWVTTGSKATVACSETFAGALDPEHARPVTC